MKICREYPNLIKIGQEYGALHMKTLAPFIAAGDIISTRNNFLKHLNVSVLLTVTHSPTIHT
jgi:hypothetical protein